MLSKGSDFTVRRALILNEPVRRAARSSVVFVIDSMVASQVTAAETHATPGCRATAAMAAARSASSMAESGKTMRPGVRRGRGGRAADFDV